MTPKVSILIPAFNSEKWIAGTLRSAIDQSWPNTEIVVVDDGSSDRTLEIARQFSSKDVLVLTQPNSGGSAARNRAFAACQGEYVQWLDADDLLAPNKIACQLADGDVPAMTLMSSAWGSFVHSPSSATFKPTALWRDLSPVEWLLLKLRDNLFIANGAWLVSRELTEISGPWDETLSYDDDGEYFARVLTHCDFVRFFPDARMFYRKSRFGSMSDLEGSNRKFESKLRSMQLHVQYLLTLENSERVRRASLEYLQRGVGEFGIERLDLFESARELASELGGEILPPRLSWKFRWLGSLVGPQRARRVERALKRLKWSWIRRTQKAADPELFRMIP